MRWLHKSARAWEHHMRLGSQSNRLIKRTRANATTRLDFPFHSPS